MLIDGNYKLKNTLFFAFAFFAILGYTELPLKADIVKPLVQLLFILITINNVNFKNYLWVIPLLLIVVIFPLLAIILGVYNYNVTQIIFYMVAFLLMLLFVICVSNTYKYKIHTIINIWYYALNLSFLILFILYRGISLNLPYLFHAMLSNDRYGANKLFQRYSMGFTNINTFALFSSILLICVFYQLIHRTNIILSLVDIPIGIIFILNSESRSPIVVILILLLIYIILSIRNDIIRKILGWIIFIMFFGYIAVYIYLMLSSNKLFRLYNIIDSISSFRLSFGSQAVSVLSQYGNVLFGLGPMSTTYITNNIFGKLLTIDVSFEYYIFTIGIVGMLLLYGFFIWIFIMIRKVRIEHKFAIMIVSFYFVYSLFENILFIPNSAASLFCLSIIFTYLSGLITDLNQNN